MIDNFNSFPLSGRWGSCDVGFQLLASLGIGVANATQRGLTPDTIFLEGHTYSLLLQLVKVYEIILIGLIYHEIEILMKMSSWRNSHEENNLIWSISEGIV